MVMMRFTVSKLTKRKSSGVAVCDAPGNVVCSAQETPYGYVLCDGDNNKAVIGTLVFKKRTAQINIPEDKTLIVKRRLFGGIKFPKESFYHKQGKMRRFKVNLFENGQLAMRVVKNPDRRSRTYFLDVWKGTNALRSMLIAIAFNDFFLHK
ncbi:MAG: hypothetical protein LBT30_08480, partial [Clostridiales bacterium]|nr:hypothetical protein [Clostridiales bacterium]